MSDIKTPQNLDKTLTVGNTSSQDAHIGQLYEISASTGSQTVISGQGLIVPALSVGASNTYTVNSGATLISFITLTVLGTLTTLGTSKTI